MDETKDWSDRRADARRNHERVLAAAIDVFTEEGLGASVSKVAARAGVGKATVFRSYPTKSDLVRAIGQRHVDWMINVTLEVEREAEIDAYQALKSGLEKIMMRIAEDRLLVDVMGGIEGLDTQNMGRHSDRALELGREQGTIRSDVTGMDVQVLVAGVARTLLDLDVRDPEVWRRYAGLCLAALKP